MYNFLNQLLINVSEAGYEAIVYDAFNTASVFVAVIFGLWYGKKLDIKFLKRLILLSVNIISLLGIMMVELWVETGFQNFDKKEIAVAFAYSPVIAFVFSKILHVPFKKTADLMAFTPLVIHAVARGGCVFAGCCYGFVSDFGIYNMRTGQEHFPVQLLEVFLVIIIITALLLIAKSQKYNTHGILMPYMLIMYSVARFLTEFLHDNNKIWMNLSSVSFHALLMFVVGIILLCIIKRQHKCSME